MVPVIERLQGQVNGSNVIFETSRPYRAGTVRVFLSGLVGEEIKVDGWIEKGGTVVCLKEPPRPGDVIQAYYVAT